MAWTDKYVSALAAGGGDGSTTTPWTIEEGFQNLAAGMRLFVINDGTYTPSTTLTPSVAIASYDPVAMVLGCKSDLSVVLDPADYPVIDFSGLATGNGIDFAANSSCSVFLYGLYTKNAPTDNINLYQYSVAAFCRSDNGGYTNFRGYNYNKFVFCDAADAGSYGYYCPANNSAFFCRYIYSSDPPATTGFWVSYAAVGCVSINASTGFNGRGAGTVIISNTGISNGVTEAYTGINVNYNSAIIALNLIDGPTNGIVSSVTSLSLRNLIRVSTTPHNDQDTDYAMTYYHEDTATDPMFKDSAARDFRPQNKDLEALFDIIKQNPGAFPYLPKGGWRPRPRWHGV